MNHSALNLELPEVERQNIWPWLVALTAGVCLLISVAQKLQSIPVQLKNSTQQYVNNSGFNTLNIGVNGREITVTGTSDGQLSLDNLISGIQQIEGVRSVRQDVTVIDAVAESATRTQSFLTSLALIRTASVAFEPGSSSFAQSSGAALAELARLMTAYPDTRIRIEGHTDNTGPESVNLRLSRQRAQAVASYLSSRGVADNRLIAKGYGSTQPIDDNFTDAGRARNRRIEISYLD
ncbi:MAG: outer membrane protein OmpA-like peptidoglycan-associated protein [Granulosicoccus sp.]|jgi:outer membrane protein OmpA-like peptidoglycan-associated protein